MKCKECSSCKKGWFKSKPDKYVCIGVPEPFVISDINHECTEYEEKKNKKIIREDCLVISYEDSSDGEILIVGAKNNDRIDVLKAIYGNEAYGIYMYLTGAGELMQKKEDEEEAHWYLLDECSNEGVYCSKCHKKVYKKCYANQKLKSKFCPNCGKKMSGEFKVL